MEVIYILAADYANTTHDGKLNVMGIFGQIRYPKFPTHHPQMHFVAQINYELQDYGSAHELTVKLIDPDGADIISVTGPINVQPANDGRMPDLNVILPLNNVLLEKPGRHEFAVFIDSDKKSYLGIDVIKLPQKPI